MGKPRIISHDADLEANKSSSDDITVTGVKGEVHPVYSTSSTREKIIAYSSIAFGVIGFAIFLYFYLAPLFKARRDAKSARKRRMLLKPFSSNDRKLYGLDASCSFYSNGSNDYEPLLPRRIVPKDSVTRNRAGQAAAPIDLNPILSRLSSSRPEPSSSPFTDHNASRGEFLTSTPPRGSSAVIASSPANLSDSMSFTFIISNSEDSLNDKTPISPLKFTPLQAQSNILPPLDTLSSSRSRSGSIPPRSSTLRTVISADSNLLANIEAGSSKAMPIAHEENTCDDSPVYADVILPRYLRDSMKSSYRSHDPEKIEPSPKVQSLHLPDTVLARASSYTRGLVGSSAPKSGKPSGMELQFEMVKQV
ncbi:hypothetical protein ACEPAI_9771 [Sanghuangporus weigelae]